MVSGLKKFFFFLLFVATNVLGQSYEYDLIPYRSGKSWGFCDVNKVLVIDTIYDQTNPFLGGLAQVFDNGFSGCINQRGDTIIPIVHDFMRFKEGVPLIEAEKDEKWGAYDYEGNLIIPFEYGDFVGLTEGLIGFYGMEGSGYFDEKGNKVLSFGHRKIRPYSEGYAATARFDTINKKWIWGYMDESGEVVIPFQYDNADPFFRGRAIVRLKYHYGLINKAGEELIPIEFRNLLPGKSGIYQGKNRDNREVLVDSTGLEYHLVPTMEEQMPSEGYTEEDFLKFEFIVIPDYAVYSEGLIQFARFSPMQIFESHTPGLHGFMNLSGEIVIPAKYDYVSSFINGLAVAVLDGKLNYIDQNDSLVLQTDFIWGSPFYCRDYAMVLIDEGHFGFIDRSGSLFFKAERWNDISFRMDSQFGDGQYTGQFNPCADFMFVMLDDNGFGWIGIDGTKYYDE